MREYKVYYHKVPKELSGYDYDKYYIGVTTRKNIVDRWGKHGENYSRQPFYNAIKKYGWDNIEHKVLFTGLTEDQAKEMEKSLIKNLHSRLGELGYNVTDGGDGLSGMANKYTHPVYCITLDILFKSASLAAEYTKDTVRVINNDCKIYTDQPTTERNRYCYYEDIYKYYTKFKLGKRFRPVVDINTGKLYGCLKQANESLGWKVGRKSVLNIEDYFKRERSGALERKKEYLMYADDYVKVFDMTN